MSTPTGPLLGLLAVLVTVCALALSGRRRDGRDLDLAMALGLLAWMVFVSWQSRFAPVPPAPVDEFIEHMSYQISVSAATWVALVGARASEGHSRALLCVQQVGGALLLLAWTWSGDKQWYSAWEVFNWVIVGGLLVWLLRRISAQFERASLAMGLVSLVLLVYCLVADLWHYPSSRVVIAGLFIYPSAMVILWYLVSAQMRRRQQAAGGLGELQRQRIAQDVHDGVGSQLVAILSSLDPKNPEQQALAASLEQCLLDLKLTVDTLQDEVPSLVDGLAMLRYRIQPSLTRLGVTLDYEVDDHPGLAALPPLAAMHGLRIAQEAVANVMRHARATHMVLVCRYVAQEAEAELRVEDDGRGLGQPLERLMAQGRGLRGMQRRSGEARLRLLVSERPEGGTRVLLRLPVAPPLPPT